MNAKATGRHETRDGQEVVVLSRTFRAPIADVWAAVTVPDRLARWIGTWAGDPTSGSVRFRMNAEGDDVPEETFEIRACEPPHRLMVHAGDGDAAWDLGLELVERDGMTTLEFTQVIPNPPVLESVGPGWEYYLDRLVAAETGGDPSKIDFDRDYYPALSGYYTGRTTALITDSNTARYRSWSALEAIRYMVPLWSSSRSMSSRSASSSVSTVLASSAITSEDRPSKML